MLISHPLLLPSVVRDIERAASTHLGRRWMVHGFTDLNDRASHPCGLLHGDGFSLFAKLDPAGGRGDQFHAEVAGLRLLRDRAHVTTPTPVASGVIEAETGWVLLLEAVAEARSPQQWRSIGRALALTHQARSTTFGLAEFDGFFGPPRRPAPPRRAALPGPRPTIPPSAALSPRSAASCPA